MNPRFHHSAARETLLRRLDFSLSAAEDSLLQQHLQQCPECRRFAAQQTRLHTLLPQIFAERWGEAGSMSRVV